MALHWRLVVSGVLLTLAAWLYTRPDFTLFPREPIPAVSHSTVDVGSQWTHQAAAAALLKYGETSNVEVERMKTTFGRGSHKHRGIGHAIGYPRKLDRFGHVETVNGKFTRHVARDAMARHGLNETDVARRTEGAMFRVREALQHLSRDWSEEGERERSATFGPILDVLKQEKRGKVLVPGAGLGRLAWEISQLGFDTSANELSPYMNFVTQHLFTTSHPFQHQIYPWAHRFSNQRTAEANFRSVSIPDVVPRQSSTFRLLEQDFLNIKEGGYDYIITQFFIDASSNTVSIIEQIYKLLSPLGRWINLGPLLWAGGGTVHMELSLEEVRRVVEIVGFEFESGGVKEARRVDCEYTSDKEAMLRRVYEAEFWVAKKWSPA